MNVLVTRPIPQPGIDLLRHHGHQVTINSAPPLSPQQLLNATAGIDGLITMLHDTITPALLDARPNIRAVANYAVGFNNIDVPACTARRVGAANTPGVLTDATAEVAWALIMATARLVGHSERTLRAGQWTGWDPMDFLGVDVVGQTLGLIGAGRIGARVARMAAGFDIKLLYHNRKPSAEMEQLGAKLVTLEQLLQQSDFVSLHVPLTPQTRHLIGSAQLAQMKNTAVLINTARGPVVDEAALVEALKSHRIFAAGLDVYENEPQIHPGLLQLENAVLLPHIGSATRSTREKMALMAAENLIAMLANKRPPNPINPEIYG